MDIKDTLVPNPPPLRFDKAGVLRVEGTRIPFETIVDAFDEGVMPEEIVLRYDTLQLSDVYQVIGYYLKHRAEVKAYLNKQRQRAAEVQRETERRFPPDGLRERLLARESDKRPA